MLNKSLFASTLLAAGLAVPTLATAQETRELYAGQDMLVGSVTVDSDADNLYVDAEIDDPEWTLIESHFYADLEAPTKAAPGQFPYTHSELADLEDSFAVSLDELGAASGDELYLFTYELP